MRGEQTLCTYTRVGLSNDYLGNKFIHATYLPYFLYWPLWYATAEGNPHAAALHLGPTSCDAGELPANPMAVSASWLPSSPPSRWPQDRG